MKSQGYVIAKNGKVAEYFTSTSSYDRPIWTTVTEATVYITPDLAAAAALKLAKCGAYGAKIVPVAEAFEFEMPPGEFDGDTELDDPSKLDGQTDSELDNDEDKMTANDQVDPDELENQDDLAD